MKRKNDFAAHLAKLKAPKSQEHKQKIREGVQKYWDRAKEESPKPVQLNG